MTKIIEGAKTVGACALALVVVGFAIAFMLTSLGFINQPNKPCPPHTPVMLDGVDVTRC